MVQKVDKVKVHMVQAHMIHKAHIVKKVQICIRYTRYRYT